MGFVEDWVIPVGSVVGAVVISIVTIWGLYVIFKAIGLFKLFSWIKIRLFKHKKLLADEKIVDYCTDAVVNGKTDGEFVEQLLLSNKYDKKQIKEMVYVFNIIKKEIKEIKL